MNQKTETLLKSYKPKLMIVAYTPLDNWHDCYLESHVINEKGEVMEGKPLLQETIQGMVDIFFDERKNTSRITGFIPENLLAYEQLPGGHYDLIWWRPAELKHIFFADQLKIPSGTAWVPPLVYHVENKDLSVYALLKDERPNEKTLLYRAPFHNVSNDGGVCLGSAKVKKPERMTYQTIMKYWEDMFWLSEFTHLNGATKPTKSDLSDIWRKLIKNKKINWSQMQELKQMNPKTTINSLYE